MPDHQQDRRRRPRWATSELHPMDEGRAVLRRLRTVAEAREAEPTKG